jgi:hypothetical protein
MSIDLRAAVPILIRPGRSGRGSTLARSSSPRTSSESGDRRRPRDPKPRASTDGEIVRPSVLAVFRLITSSNLIGCSMGRSPGLAPLRIILGLTRSSSQRWRIAAVDAGISG